MTGIVDSCFLQPARQRRWGMADEAEVKRGLPHLACCLPEIHTFDRKHL